MNKDQLIDGIIEREGGYVNDSCDSGGETNYGITEEQARYHGYEGAMCDLPIDLAREIYATAYWHAVKADDLLLIDEALAEEIVDTGVNCGTERATSFLQTALNSLNLNGALYDDVAIDGKFGPATLACVQAYAESRKPEALTSACNCLQGAFYISLTEKRPKDEKFVYGWLLNRV